MILALMVERQIGSAELIKPHQRQLDENMDRKTRKAFEHFCALAEEIAAILQNPQHVAEAIAFHKASGCRDLLGACVANHLYRNNMQVAILFFGGCLLYLAFFGCFLICFVG